MSPQTRPSRVAEWAELVGDPVPDVVRDGEESASASGSGSGSGSGSKRVTNRLTRWTDATTSNET